MTMTRERLEELKGMNLSCTTKAGEAAIQELIGEIERCWRSMKGVEEWCEQSVDAQKRSQVKMEAVYGRQLEGFDKFKEWAQDGCVVSSGVCSEMEIANARSRGDFWVDKDGLGYVHRSMEWLKKHDPEYARACDFPEEAGHLRLEGLKEMANRGCEVEDGRKE